MYLSVIIPTYNRVSLLLNTLQSIGQQTMPSDRFEVVVVDDGSVDDTFEILGQTSYPFPLRVIRQENSGATVARNVGVHNSRGDVLVFLDDDISLCPEALHILAEECSQFPRTILVGTLIWCNPAPKATRFSEILYEKLNAASEADRGRVIGFSCCRTGLLAIRRDDFLEIGMFQDPTGGWPNWDDVDFGYRASQRGFTFRQSAHATGFHWDLFSSEVGAYGQWWKRASQSAARLLHKYPDLKAHLPMFWDKIPVAWGVDPWGTVVRKTIRRFSAARWMIDLATGAAHILERIFPHKALLWHLYLWITGGYIVQGFRQGLLALKFGVGETGR
jgi:glycosyltransferase involved in cell wall biosynthesis